MNFNDLLRFRLPKGKINKNADTYLNKVYALNKDRIIESYERAGLEVNAKRQFKRSVKEYMSQGRTLKQTLTYMSRTETYTPPELKFRITAAQSLKKHGLINELRKRYGWRNKFDISKLKYVGDRTYSYGDIRISFENSPENIIMYNVSNTKPSGVSSELDLAEKKYVYNKKNYYI